MAKFIILYAVRVTTYNMILTKNNYRITRKPKINATKFDIFSKKMMLYKKRKKFGRKNPAN